MAEQLGLILHDLEDLQAQIDRKVMILCAAANRQKMDGDEEGRNPEVNADMIAASLRATEEISVNIVNLPDTDDDDGSRQFVGRLATELAACTTVIVFVTNALLGRHANQSIALYCKEQTHKPVIPVLGE